MEAEGEQLVEETSEDDTLSSRDLAAKRECPIPKPGGLVGDILGFKASSSEAKGSRPP